MTVSINATTFAHRLRRKKVSGLLCRSGELCAHRPTPPPPQICSRTRTHLEGFGAREFGRVNPSVLGVVLGEVVAVLARARAQGKRTKDVRANGDMKSTSHSSRREREREREARTQAARVDTVVPLEYCRTWQDDTFSIENYHQRTTTTTCNGLEYVFTRYSSRYTTMLPQQGVQPPPPM